MTIWRQKRPAWCPHQTCIFRRRTQDSACGGELPKPEPHGAGLNTHRICLRIPKSDDDENPKVIDFQVNSTDLGWLRWIMDALDGLATSWLSQRDTDSEEGNA